MATNYAQATISAVCSLHDFGLSLDQFIVKGGATAIAVRGREATNAVRFFLPP